MRSLGSDKAADEVILCARILLVLLFIIFGWSKLTNFSGTIGYMAQDGLPLPWAAAAVAVIVEFFIGIALLLGLWTRPLALLLAIYTLFTAFIGHHFWTMEGTARAGNAINFYKNFSITGAFLLLYVTGAGRYSLDWKMTRQTYPVDALRSR
jgi:putative oxidoreductase